jgi:hypothetical protein
VQRRVAHGDAGEFGGLEVGDRRHRAGAADLRADLQTRVVAESRRELVGERPAWRARRAPELAAAVQAVDLGDGAVEFVRQFVALLFELVADRRALRRCRGDAGRLGDLRSPTRRAVGAAPGACEIDAFDVTDGKRDEVEWPALDHARIEQLERAGNGVASVAERAFAARLLALLQAANPRRLMITSPRISMRAGNGPGPASAAAGCGSCADCASGPRPGCRRRATGRAQHAVFVEQVGAGAVELRLATPRRAVSSGRSAACATRSSKSRTSSAAISDSMLPIGARCGTVGNVPPFGSGAPTRWVGESGGDQFWVRLLRACATDEQDVVFRVGEVAVAAVVVLIVRGRMLARSSARRWAAVTGQFVASDERMGQVQAAR